MWQAHGNDTSVSVHMNQIMARFSERDSRDDQWICLPAQLAVGKALITSGQSEPGCEMMACFPVYSLYAFRMWQVRSRTCKHAVLKRNGRLTAFDSSRPQWSDGPL